MQLPADGAGDEPPRGGPSDEEVDRRFAELTAALGPAAAPPADPVAAAQVEAAPPETAPPPLGPRDYAVPDEPDSYVPPEPEPLTTADPIQLLGWAGAAGGPIAMILIVLLWPSAPGLVWLVAIAATLVGWGVVVWRLPRSRDDDDDGAVV